VVRVLYKVLLIPAQDYTRHPHLTRHHHIFENFDDQFKLAILNVRLRIGPKSVGSRNEIIEVGVPTRNVLHSYIWGYFSFHFKLASLLKSGKYDCVVLSNVISPLVPLLAHGRPIVFDYKDVYSLSASAPFRAPIRQLVYLVARFFEHLLFSFRMTVVVPSPSMQLLVRDRFNVDSLLIPNGVNTELFHPISSNTRDMVRTEIGVRQGEFCLCYLGSIENWLDLESVIHALVSLKSLRLVMIGGPPRSARYLHDMLALCDREGVRERVTLTGFRNQAEAARILAACDAAIIPFSLRHELSAVALPDKAFEYLASGLPAISTRLPDVERLFGKLIYFYDDHDELCSILRGLINHPSKRNLREQLSQAKKYDWKAIAKTYQELISGLVTSDETSKINRH